MSALQVCRQVDTLWVSLSTDMTTVQWVWTDVVRSHVLTPSTNRLANVITPTLRARNRFLLMGLKMDGESRVCLESLVADEALVRSVLCVSVDDMLPESRWTATGHVAVWTSLCVDVSSNMLLEESLSGKLLVTEGARVGVAGGRGLSSKVILQLADAGEDSST